MMGRRKLVSIVIKALNEQERIAACLESALKAIEGLDGEVILADSGSTDGTLDIAAGYPVRIVQLVDRRLRRCGVGPQLGYQFASGRYIYVLDGDMELDSGFLRAGIAALERDPGLGGVAGLVEEISDKNLHFRGRKERNQEGRAGPVASLDMGGLYRNAALDEVGYLSNRNLHACEEQELGLRLAAAGWRLERLPVRGITHYGHTDPTFTLQRKRWRSGYLMGPGEVLRSSLGAPYLRAVLHIHRHLLVTLALLLALLAGLLILPVTSAVLLLWLTAFLTLLVQRTFRYRSLRDALAVLAIWHIDAVALVRGFLRPQVDPREPIEAVELSSEAPRRQA